MSYLGIEPEGESKTSLDFDSAVLLEGEAEEEIVIGCRRSVQFSVDSQESIYEKWREKLAEDVEIVVGGTSIKIYFTVSTSTLLLLDCSDVQGEH